MWCVMAESCLTCLCSLCPRSTRYHFVPPHPLPPSTSRSASPSECTTQPPHRGFCCQGNRHPRRHPMTVQGEGGGTGRKGRRCDFGPLQSTPDLWPFPSTHCPSSDTHKYHTQNSSVFIHTGHICMHQNTQARAKERNGQKLKEREDSKLFESELSSESVCV